MPARSSPLYHAAREPDAFVTGRDVHLACYCDGDPAHPTLVFVHGYPDTAQVWDRLVKRLAEDFYCVRYDVRGAGRSSRPAATAAYGLSYLEADLAAVIDWAAPTGKPVHLIGHDWGSIQSWEAATDEAMASRLASYTSISGPCLDHIGQGMAQRWRDDRRGALRQARRSWYVALFQVPGLAEYGWQWLMAPRWPRMLARLEGQALPVAPTWAADGRAGIRLYRANMLPRFFRPRARHAVVPVHLVIAQRDPFVGQALARLAEHWADTIETSTFDAGHWLIETHAAELSSAIRDWVMRFNPSSA